MVLQAADWLVAQPVADQGDGGHFYNTCYQTSQAIAQLGGEYWQNFYPRVVERLLGYQDPAGNFREDRWQPFRTKSKQGPTHQTALAILCLTLPDQLLPIHQR
jgi:hypothetical protein